MANSNDKKEKTANLGKAKESLTQSFQLEQNQPLVTVLQLLLDDKPAQAINCFENLQVEEADQHIYMDVCSRILIHYIKADVLERAKEIFEDTKNYLNSQRPSPDEKAGILENLLTIWNTVERTKDNQDLLQQIGQLWLHHKRMLAPTAANEHGFYKLLPHDRWNTELRLPQPAAAEPTLDIR